MESRLLNMKKMTIKVKGKNKKNRKKTSSYTQKKIMGLKNAPFRSDYSSMVISRDIPSNYHKPKNSKIGGMFHSRSTYFSKKRPRDNFLGTSYKFGSISNSNFKIKSIGQNPNFDLDNSSRKLVRKTNHNFFQMKKNKYMNRRNTRRKYRALESSMDREYGYMTKSNLYSEIDQIDEKKQGLSTRRIKPSNSSTLLSYRKKGRNGSRSPNHRRLMDKETKKSPQNELMKFKDISAKSYVSFY